MGPDTAVSSRMQSIQLIAGWPCAGSVEMHLEPGFKLCQDTSQGKTGRDVLGRESSFSCLDRVGHMLPAQILQGCVL